MRFFIIIILFITSCQSGNEVNKNRPIQDSESIKDNQEEQSAEIESDTIGLRTFFHWKYLSDLPRDSIAKLILIDSIQPSDNLITFAILDSISSPNKRTRDYYFPVFRVIMNKSDGAVSEVVGLYAKQYAEKYPNEFFDRYQCCDSVHSCCEELIAVAKFIQYEIGMQANIDTAYYDFVGKIETEERTYLSDRITIIFRDNLTNGIDQYY